MSFRPASLSWLSLMSIYLPNPFLQSGRPAHPVRNLTISNGAQPKSTDDPLYQIQLLCQPSRTTFSILDFGFSSLVGPSIEYPVSSIYIPRTVPVFSPFDFAQDGEPVGPLPDRALCPFSATVVSTKTAKNFPSVHKNTQFRHKKGTSEPPGGITRILSTFPTG
jgi:hypothetical protein